MVIVETTIFTRQIQELLSDDEYRRFQMALVLRPDLGVVIPGSGGLRKVRWAAKGHGKSGGIRIIYYWAVSPQRILLLLAYPKNVRDDMTSEQLKVVRKIVEEEYP